MSPRTAREGRTGVGGFDTETQMFALPPGETSAPVVIG